jgi:RNA-directed DNA polymerase
LRAEGFAPHPSKTRVLRPGTSQRVTGLVINRTTGENAAPARVPRDVVRRLRAAIHNREKGKPGKPGETLHQLKGLAAFVMMTDRARGRAFLDRLGALEAREAPPAEAPARP